MSDPFPTTGLATQLDPDNPWPGLDSFEEGARDYFHGRDEEADELLRRVTDAPLTVLFGKSGLGKTSLLKAGLFPRLREKHFLPVHVRLDIRPEAPPLIEQIGDALGAAIEREGVDAPELAEGETLWEYLHRADLELWSEQNYPLIPVLVLDQFEEVFTLGEHLPAKVDRFQVDLGDLAENRIPETLAARLAIDAAPVRQLDLRVMPYKLIVTLREDFLPHLEGWRRAVPSLGRARVRLLPMRPDQAFAAVYDTASHLMDKPLARRIVEFVGAAQTAETTAPAHGGEIEPALLSLFCRGLNERRKRQGQTRFDEHLLEGAQESIIADYYRSCVEGFPDGVSRFIESELVTGKGFRNSYARDDAVPDHLTQEQLDRLINRRLLRLEERHGTVRIELTHDLLTRAVMEQRDRRRVEEEQAALARQAEEQRRALEDQTRKQRRRIRAMAVVAVICLAFAGLAGWQWRQAVVATSAARKAAEKEQDATIRAVGAKRVAERATAEAQGALLEANTQKSAAEEARGEAQRQTELAETRAREASAARQMAEEQARWGRVAFARELAAFALPMVKASDQDELAALLGMHAVAATYTAEQTATREAEDVLRRAVGGSVKELPFPGHQGEIGAIAFSPDGTQLATAAADGTLRVWNAATGDEIRRANVKGWDDLAFGPDGIRLAFTKRPGVGSAVHDVLGRSLLDVVGRSRQPGIVSLSRDGRRLAVADAGTLTVWEIATRREVKTPIGKWSGAFALNAGGTRVAVLDPNEPMVHVRDVDADSVLRSFPADGKAVKIALSPDGRLLAIAVDISATPEFRTTLVRIRDGSTGKQWADEEVSGAVDDMKFSTPDGRYLAIAFSGVVARDSTGVHVWDATTHRPVHTLPGRPPLAFSADGSRLATASDKTSVTVWDTKSGIRLATLSGRSESALEAVAFGSDARRVVTASKDGKLRIWDPTLGRPVHTLPAGGNIQLLALSPSRGRVAAWGQPGELRVWDLSSVGTARQIPFRANRLLDMAFTDNGARLLTAAYQGQRGLELWDVASAGPVQVPYAPGDDRRNMFAVAFSRDEKRVAAASVEEATVREVASARGALLQIRGHWYDLVFAGPTGRWLAVSDSNRTEVWDVDTGRKISQGPIAGASRLKVLGKRLALRDDGRLVATVAGDRRTATVWDAATGVRQSTFYRHDGDIRAIEFTPDGRQVAVVVDDWTVHYHPVTIPDLMALARTRVTSPMSPENCQKYFGRPQCPSLGR